MANRRAASDLTCRVARPPRLPSVLDLRCELSDRRPYRYRFDHCKEVDLVVFSKSARLSE